MASFTELMTLPSSWTGWSRGRGPCGPVPTRWWVRVTRAALLHPDFHSSATPRGALYRAATPRGALYRAATPRGALYRAATPPGALYPAATPPGALYPAPTPPGARCRSVQTAS